MSRQRKATAAFPPRFVPLGGGTLAPAESTFTADVGAYTVELDVAHRSGRFVCDRLAVTSHKGGPPVTAEGLRAVPVAALVRLAVEASLLHAEPAGQGFKATFAAPAALSERARSGGGPSDADLRAVADTYRVAYATGERPTRAVMDRLRLPRSTASRWVRQARERGLLGPATPRKAGG